MAILLSTIGRNGAADGVVDKIDAGAGAGKLKIYTAAKASLLASLTFSDPAFGDAATGVATANAITDDSAADNTGVAAVFTATDFDDNVVLEGTVGGLASGEDMELNTTNIVAGGVVSVSSFTFTQPASA